VARCSVGGKLETHSDFEIINNEAALEAFEDHLNEWHQRNFTFHLQLKAFPLDFA